MVTLREIMTDDETPESCTAVLDLPEGPNTPYPCTLAKGHEGPHRDRDGNHLHGRTHGDLIRELHQRICELEGRMSPPVVRGPEPNEDRPCTAVLKLNGHTERTCDAGSHQGPHRDPDSGDIWETEQKGAVQVSRPRYEELVRRSSQLTALERDDMTLVSRTAWEQYQKDSDRLTALENLQNPVCGHRDPSSERVCQRPPDHYGEVHSDTPRQFDATVWGTVHRSAEHQTGQKTPSEECRWVSPTARKCDLPDGHRSPHRTPVR